MKKRKIVLICILVIAALLVGCGKEIKENSNKGIYTREEVMQQMLDYLDEKYGEEFDVLDVEYQDWSRNWEKLYAVPKGKGKEYEFVVYRLKNENGDIYYTDDFFIIAQKDKYGEHLKTYVDKYFDEYKFRFYFDWHTNEKNTMNQYTSFEEFDKYAKNNLCLTFLLFTKEGTEEKASTKFNSLYEDLSTVTTRGVLYLYDYSTANYNEHICKATNELEYDGYYSYFKINKRWG